LRGLVGLQLGKVRLEPETLVELLALLVEPALELLVLNLLLRLAELLTAVAQGALHVFASSLGHLLRAPRLDARGHLRFVLRTSALRIPERSRLCHRPAADRARRRDLICERAIHRRAACDFCRARLVALSGGREKPKGLASLAGAVLESRVIGLV